MTAAAGAGWYAGFGRGGRGHVVATTMPTRALAETWADLSRRQAQVYLYNRGLY